MKKFGFGKKHSDGGDDANRSALFGKKGSPGPASDNPYAQAAPADDPYMNEMNSKFAKMTPYQQARAQIPSRSAGAGAGGLPSGPAPRNGYGAPSLSRNDSSHSSATTLPPYSSAPPSVHGSGQPSGQPSGGYANDRYGTASGYGASKYGNSNNYGAAPGSGAARPGGYGGMGRTNSNDTDANRDALFSGAQERLQRQGGPPETIGTAGGDEAASKYGGYGEQRELTEEEKDYEEYKNIKQDIRDTTKSSLQSTENSLRILDQTLDSGMASYARLGAQHERLHNTDQLLDSAVEKQRHADAQTKKLKTLNRSMFAVHVKNPFTEKRKTAEDEQRVITENQFNREARDATRREKFAQGARMEANYKELARDNGSSSFSKPNRNDRNKYTLEDDSDEEGARELDNDNEAIENNLDALYNGSVRLGRVAKALGEELDHGNQLIDRIGSKTDPLDDQLRVTNRRLELMNK
ncbi:hypothetical protein F4819DRAFT_341150 [Hypoxylon fuscum]|nr:hypothetical protein F4819DRAFT_341150 [Hypoxylon fuscum]